MAEENENENAEETPRPSRGARGRGCAEAEAEAAAEAEARRGAGGRGRGAAAARRPTRPPPAAAAEPGGARGDAPPQGAPQALAPHAGRGASRRARPRSAPPSEREAQRARKAAQRRAYRAKARSKAAERARRRARAEPVEAAEHGPGRPRVRQGIVVSDKADKTITVRIDIARRHRRYEQDRARPRRRCTRTTRRNDAHEGDTVRVVECRPLLAHQALAPGRGPGACPVIQNETRLKVADNTGAREILCIRVKGGSRRRYAGVGDVIVGDRQAGQPAGLGQEGRGRDGRGRAHEEGVRPRGRHLHRLRRERRGDHRRPEQPARHAHLRARWPASCATATS